MKPDRCLPKIPPATAAWLLLVCWFAAPLWGQEEYLRNVKPVLTERCYACHGALKQESGLRLDTVENMLEAGVVEPGSAADSELLSRVSAADESLRMPPEGSPLTAAQIDAIAAWIAAGAAAPEGEAGDADPRQHWAFQLKRPAVPVVEQSSAAEVANPVDAFLAAGRARRRLKTVPEAERSLLLRRVYLDLIGLPPRPEQLRDFLADTRPGAWQRAVDRLLASPMYGERWGRHWMDVWRYTDWYGLGQQLRYSQKHIWHWRDWIVESLNADTGYDQMVLQMLAADELAPTNADQLRATGFLARNYFLFNRTTWLDDTIEHTSKALLGLTMNCSKCHDHKYDPILQDDYYRLRAVFEPHHVRLDPVPGETDLERDGLPRVYDAHVELPTYVHVRGDAKQPDTSRVIEPGVPALFGYGLQEIDAVQLPPEAHSPALRPFVLADQLAAAKRQIQQAERAVEQAKTQLQQLREAENAAEPESGPVFLSDTFDQPREETWEQGPGDWKYESGRLVQSETGAERRYLRTREEHPADFQATLRFRTLGGEKWKSVGLCFDVVDGREKMVYLSAVQPGSKLQLALKTGPSHTYPADAKQDRAVALDQWYELTILVRDQLLNVSLDGRHALAYRLPVEREPGRLDVAAFDAVAEYDSLEVRSLPESASLVEPGGQAPVSVAEAEAQLKVAERALAVAQRRPDSLRTAVQADAARCSESAADSCDDLIQQAAAAARQLALAQAEHALAQAELSQLQAADGKSQAEVDKAAQALKAAQQKAQQARQAVEQPGAEYESLRASRKALEGPAETEESRRQPYPRVSTGRRTALARWMIDRRNPLVARVAANHIWMRHFGQPLVETVVDFGRRAPEPPQRELLDYLAVELIDSGWSMKHLHRLIVNSHAYRLSSSTLRADESTRRADPENDYYWRRRPVRLESEALRDSLLHLSGRLDMRLGGPTVDPNKPSGRRSLYFTHSRDDQQAFLSMFDKADIVQCYRRSESIVPQQALTMANSRLSLESAQHLAARIEEISEGSSDEAFLQAAFETVLCRRPHPPELAACLETLQQLAEQPDVPDVRSHARIAVVHALLNHNDFVTIR